MHEHKIREPPCRVKMMGQAVVEQETIKHESKSHNTTKDVIPRTRFWKAEDIRCTDFFAGLEKENLFVLCIGLFLSSLISC